MSRAGSPRTTWGGTRVASASNYRNVIQTVLEDTAGALDSIHIADRFKPTRPRATRG